VYASIGGRERHLQRRESELETLVWRHDDLSAQIAVYFDGAAFNPRGERTRAESLVEDAYQTPLRIRLTEPIALAGGADAEAGTAHMNKERLRVAAVQTQAASWPELLPGVDRAENYALQGKDGDDTDGAIRVEVTGEVTAPGTYSLKHGSRLLDAIMTAGGPGTDADLSAVTLTRSLSTPGGYMRLTTDLHPVMAGASTESNFVLQNGDAVHVPRVAGQVRVEGEVLYPGVYSIDPDTTLSEIIAKAGGYTSEVYLDVVEIYSAQDAEQDSVSQSIGKGSPLEGMRDFSQLRFSGSPKENPRLISGDIVVVKKSVVRVWVTGQVRSPGCYDLKNDHLLPCINPPPDPVSSVGAYADLHHIVQRIS